MIQDEGYRKLEFYKDNGKKVHLIIIAVAYKGAWRNVFVLEVSWIKDALFLLMMF